MNLTIFGSSLLSSYWNGAATYYRGLFGAMARRGHGITFLEPDAYERQSHRDIEPPSWARSVVWRPDAAGLDAALDHARTGDVVVKCSGVGVHDDALLAGILARTGPAQLRVLLDVAAPAPLAGYAAAPPSPIGSNGSNISSWNPRRRCRSDASFSAAPDGTSATYPPMSSGSATCRPPTTTRSTARHWPC